MRIYVEAYYADGTQILGNMDGQRSWEGTNYKRTAWYWDLLRHHRYKRVAMYKIVNARGDVLETIKYGRE